MRTAAPLLILLLAAPALAGTPDTDAVVTVAPVAKAKASSDVVRRPWAPPPGPLSLASARRLLRRPKGSLSYGSTGNGRLLSGRKMRARGRHYRFFPHISERQTWFGTDEMQRFLNRISRAVAKKHKRAELRIGNVSLRRGGRSPWHRSHQSGRDVDLCFFARDLRGKVVKLDDFVKFGRSGRSRDGQLVFDTARNLDLAIALVQHEDIDGQTPVQWAFVARWLRKKMLKLAEKRGVPEDLRARLAEVLRQPSDSAPHDDHFHVRLFCSLQDRKYGCLDRGPLREWVNRHDDAFAAHVARVVEASALSDAKVRLGAVQLLQRVEARDAHGALVARLQDSDKRVREAALGAITALAIREAAPGVMLTIAKVQDEAWARALFDAWAGLAPEGLSAVAARVIAKPEEFLHHKAMKAADAIRVRAATLLAEKGTQESVPALIGALTLGSRSVRLSAHAALVSITNQRVRDRYLKKRHQKHWKKTAEAWTRFWKGAKGEDWQTWMKQGFRDHGVRLAKGARFVKQDIPRLIRALTSRKDHVARNANRVLVKLTGHTPWVRRQSKHTLRRHWSWWWRKRGRRLTLKG